MTDTYIPEAAQLLAKGRKYAIKRAPYCSMLYKLVPIQVPGLGTMGVSKGLVLAYDPVWLLTDPEITDYDIVGGCIFHEAMHPSLNHLVRIEELHIRVASSFSPEAANYAADYTINPPMLDASWKLPSWACHPEKQGFKKGLTLEQYYELLMRNQKKMEKMPKGVAGGKCGGAAGNPVSRALEDALDQSVGRSDAEVEQAKKSAISSMKGHAKKHGWGSIPGASKDDIIFKEKRSAVNWRHKLRHVAGKYLGRVANGGFDYSLAHPNRRAALLGVIRRGLVDPELEVAFIRDTSASMDESMINTANNEIIGVMKQMNIDEVWLLDADVKVQRKPTRVHVRDIKKLPALGRGGTSFKQALAAVQLLSPKPDVVFYLTDGYGDSPDRPPNMNVIWCTIPPCRVPAPWGTVVECKD